MICQNCKRKIATSKVACKSINGYSYTVALCDECKNHLTQHNQQSAQCSRCGTTLKALISGEAPFCPECYSSFGSDLSDYLTKIHGSAIHRGKRPSSIAVTNKKSSHVPYNDTLEKLKKDLNSAILEERYEDAAQIRDKINELKGETGNGQ